MKPIHRLYLAISTLLIVSCKKDLSYEGGTPSPFYFVSTLAGTGKAGMKDGSGEVAMFNSPKGITIDTDGNIYVGDTGNNRVRKIRGNTVSTLAGKGAAGYADGSGNTALFHSPADLVTDDAGSIFLSDLSNNRVRKITPVGFVSTIAGGPRTGYTDGNNTAAMFNTPRGVSLDGNGAVFVVDINNHCIRKVLPTGEVSTFAGNGKKGYKDGPADVAQFHLPKGLVRDQQGNLFVADMGNNTIRKISPEGVVSTVAGKTVAGFQDGSSNEALFNQPRGIAIDSWGNLYIGDTGNNRVRKIAVTGIVTTIAGNGTAGLVNGPGTSSQFNRPRMLVVDKQDKYLYVTDHSNHCIRKITL
jgi:sugar lactone lactonase YvrE